MGRSRLAEGTICDAPASSGCRRGRVVVHDRWDDRTRTSDRIVLAACSCDVARDPRSRGRAEARRDALPDRRVSRAPTRSNEPICFHRPPEARVFHRILRTTLWVIGVLTGSRKFQAWSRNSDAVSSCVPGRLVVRSLLQRPGNRTQPGKGGDFGNETPHLRNRLGASALGRGPKSFGTEDRARPSQDGRELPLRFGGTGGRSVLRLETAGGLTREVWGPRLRPRDPAAGLLREAGGERNGRKARPESRSLRRAWRARRPRGRTAAPNGREVGRQPEGRETGRRPTKGRPGVGAGRRQLRLQSERRRNPERAKVSAGASSGFSAFHMLSSRRPATGMRADLCSAHALSRTSPQPW